MSEPKKFIDVHSKKSDRKGLLGSVETIFRRFRTFAFTCAMAPICALYVICMGLSFTPGITLFQLVNRATLDWHFLFRNATLGLSMAAGFFLYGLTLIFIVPVFNKLLPKINPHRASWFSLSVLPWYYHNGLTYLVRYTFLDFITPTPINKLFYQMMGMKVGKGTIINTSNISDPCLIEIGDYVTIGGSATMVAHYGQKGMLVIDRLVIKDRATIGLKATLFGDVVVGEGAFVKANEVVMPKTRIPDVAPPKKDEVA